MTIDSQLTWMGSFDVDAGSVAFGYAMASWIIWNNPHEREVAISEVDPAAAVQPLFQACPSLPFALEATVLAASLRVLFHQRIEKRFRDSKGCPPKTVDRLSEANQAALGGKIENPQRASHTESLAASDNYALPIIHEQQIGVERNG